MGSMVPERHRAVDVHGNPYVPPAGGEFDYVTHDRWAAAGHCPVVSRFKEWCNKPAGHPEKTHGSEFRPADQRSPFYVEWSE